MEAIAEPRVRAWAPDIVFLEVANSFLKYVQQGTMTAEAAEVGLTQVLAAPLEQVATARLARQALALAIARGITAYDAAYLALALGTGAILVTADHRLAAEAGRAALLPGQGPP